MKDGSSTQRGKQKTRKEYAIEHYVELRRNKSSVEEIAKACNVSTVFIYRDVIPEVSRITGISKDNLLYHPHAKPVYTTKPGRKSKAANTAEVTSEPVVEAQEEVTETAHAEEVAPTFDDAAKEAANVQTATEVADTTEMETESPKGEDESTMLNPILRKILENVGVVRQIIQEMC